MKPWRKRFAMLGIVATYAIVSRPLWGAFSFQSPYIPYAAYEAFVILVAAAVLVALGGWCVLYNYDLIVKHGFGSAATKHTHFIPWLGGFFLALALFFLTGTTTFVWVPFILDPGSLIIPYAFVAPIIHWKQRGGGDGSKPNTPNSMATQSEKPA